MVEKELIVPEDVNIEVENKHVKVSGKKGELKREFKHFFDIKVEKKDNKIIVSSKSERRKVKATVGTIISHIKNMIKGVTEGFTYKMRIIYSHFPITVDIKGDTVLIQNFLGENKPRAARILGDTKVEVKGQDIILTGIDKEDVSQTAGNIETATRITGKDRRIYQDGCFIIKGK